MTDDERRAGDDVASLSAEDDALVSAFRLEMDRACLSDSFLMSVLNGLRTNMQVWYCMTRAFGTLDELLAVTRDELLAVQGIGPKTAASAVAELGRRGLKLRRPPDGHS